jgi:hypothetical protein
MGITARPLLTWEAVMRMANSLDISRENTLRIPFLEVRVPWEKHVPMEALCLVDGAHL